MPREREYFTEYVLELGNRDSSIIIEGIRIIIENEEKALGEGEEILDLEYRVEYLYKLYRLEEYLESISKGD